MQPRHGWISTVLTHPRKLLVFFLIIWGALGAGVTQLVFNGDYRVYFENDDPHKVAFEAIQTDFNKSENLSFLIVPESGTVYQPETFRLLYQLTEAAWQTPLSNRVESLANYQYSYADNDDLVVTDLIGADAVSDNDIAWVRRAATSTPEVAGRLIADDGRAAMVNVTVQLPDGDPTAAVSRITAFARTLQKEYSTQFPNHTIMLTGVVVLNNAFSEAAQRDASTLIPLMFVIIAAMLAVLVRSVFAAFATLLVVFASIGMTMGLAGWAGLYLSTATVNVPTLVTTLAVADCIHIIVTTRLMLQGGMEKATALQAAVRQNLKPILITSITTAIGFLMLNFAAVPVLADLGNLTALGVMIACVLSLTVLPVLLLLMPFKRPRASQKTAGFFDTTGKLVVRHHRRILPYSALLMVLAVVYAFNNTLNDVVVDYFDSSTTFRQAVDTKSDYMGGMATINFVVDTEEEYGIANPATLQKIAVFTRWLRDRDEVNHVLSFSDTQKRLNQNMNNDDPNAYSLPREQDLASQYMLLYEMSLPYGLDLNNQINMDKSALRLVVSLDNLGSKELISLEQEARKFFKKLAPELTLRAASPALMFAHIGERNMQSMVAGTLLALVLISFLIVFALRSWRLGLVSLLTNLIPAAVGFGIWGLISGEINMALSVVLSMTLGIIVDDSVHFLTKYQAARQSGKDAAAAVRHTFSTVGVALATTTVVLSAGFAVLILSSFLLNADMGLLTVIIIVAALIIDLLFLPAFLMWLDNQASQHKQGDFT
ncbi:MMPL family transporter [Alteromonas sp. ASW11-19]|uniref:MMPL family transporter n=1 Tax=Alteromonas salexigens TaxID=2982530 RepID=A0ABT2VUR3_9ALTE|nr:MMPL family transporter [Alteromonas salexigens]MCU7555599.1 MMPL family transporter [Alteromonas salexigens]